VLALADLNGCYLFESPRVASQLAALTASDDNDAPLNRAEPQTADVGVIDPDSSQTTPSTSHDDEPGRDKLVERLSRGTEIERMAAVAALGRIGELDALVTARNDPSWRVRLEVAKSLRAFPERKASALAAQLLNDASGEVRREVVTSLTAWPLERSGPLLIDSLENAAYRTRQAASEHLARVWPPAQAFPVGSSAKVRAEQVAELRRQWTHQFGDVDREALARSQSNAKHQQVLDSESLQAARHLLNVVAAADAPGARSAAEQREAIAGLVALGPERIAVMEHLTLDEGVRLPKVVYDEVLSQDGGVFLALAELDSDDLAERRHAATRLEHLIAAQPLPRLAVARLAELGVMETDAIVWHGMLSAVVGRRDEPAARLALAGLVHPSAEVRRRACRHLEFHADPAHEPALRAALEDPDSSVVICAIRALAQPGRATETAPLERLLAAPDRAVQFEAAAALARLESPAGHAALARLTRDVDARLRRRAAIVMGELGDPQHTAALIGLLDDPQLGVRQAALDSLSKLAADADINVANGSTHGAALSTDDRIRRWKQWWQRGARQSQSRAKS